MSDKPQQLAEAAVAVSVATFLGISLGEWETIIHIGAGLVAILSGGAAFVYYIVKIRREGNDEGS